MLIRDHEDAQCRLVCGVFKDRLFDHVHMLAAFGCTIVWSRNVSRSVWNLSVARIWIMERKGYVFFCSCLVASAVLQKSLA